MQMKQKKVQRENGKNVMEQMVTKMEQGKKIVTSTSWVVPDFHLYQILSRRSGAMSSRAGTPLIL